VTQEGSTPDWARTQGFPVSDDYTPTTETVRRAYALKSGEHAEAFNRWLAAHDAEVRTEQRDKDAQIAEKPNRFGVKSPDGVKIAAAIRAAGQAPADRPRGADHA
jgi:hypothetical protein